MIVAISIWQGFGHSISPTVWALALMSGLVWAAYWAWNEERQAKEKAIAEIQELQLKMVRLVCQEWKDLAEQFMDISPLVKADWQRGGVGFDEDGRPIESFFWRGEFEKCQSLCRRAGTMLLLSEKVAGKLSDRIKKEKEADHRWLKFLTDRPRAISDRSNSTGYIGVTGKTEIIVSGTIKNVASISESACIDCSTEEIHGQC